ncbi:type VII secretion target [Lentzea sp. NPDC005914]|uniref:type VII secretion target n=1 Tax=Lentzea sp. NPDC005914 TaxID=3154572 RepID=UPI00340845FF
MSEFEVVTEALRGMVGLHGRVREDLVSANEQTKVLATIPAPMRDQVTIDYISAACSAGQKHVDDVTKLAEELQARIDELKASAEQYEKTEQANHQRVTGKS